MAYSEDIRSLVIRKVEADEPYDNISQTLKVHTNTVIKYVRQARSLLPAKSEIEHSLHVFKLQTRLHVVEVSQQQTKGVPSAEAGMIRRARRLKLIHLLAHSKSTGLQIATGEEVAAAIGARKTISLGTRVLDAEHHAALTTKQEADSTEWIVIARHWVPMSSASTCEEKHEACILLCLPLPHQEATHLDVTFTQ